MIRWLSCVVLLFGLMDQSMARTSAEELEAAYKDPAKYPLGCRDEGYDYVLNIARLVHKPDPELQDQEEGGQALFFIYNGLSQPVHLNQMLSDASTRSTYLNHVIQPRQWGVLATNQKEVRYICSVKSGKSKYGQVVSCAESLKICEYVRVKFGLNNRGNYWVVNSTTRGSAVGGVVRYGIIPR
ncbi:MAG: endopeptidase IV [Gammaproteobacteria bacterium]|nr:endopeptidase IV [Gammaproteobacteria bacterium]